MQKPDFRTIADFRKRHIKQLGRLFVQVVKLCEEAGLVKLGHIALDGTRIHANASFDKSKTYKHICAEKGELEASMRKLLERSEALDEEEDREYGEDKRGDETPDWFKDAKERARRLAEAKKRLEEKHQAETEERAKAEKAGRKPRAGVKKSSKPDSNKRYNFTDPDSEIQRSRGGFLQGYNAQAAVEHGHQVIVACHVTSHAGDKNELKPALEQIRKAFGKAPKEASMDYGYLSAENVRLCTDKGIRPYIALGRDCSESKRPIRQDSALGRMSRCLKKAGRRSRYRLRKITVEPVFGIIKFARGFSRFLLRGLVKVNAEWSLVCAAFNLRKLSQVRA